MQRLREILFILRWLYSEQEAYKLPAQLAAEYGIAMVQVLVNDFYPDALHGPVTSSAARYEGYAGYRYDYAYADDRKKGTLKRIKEKLNVTR